jgi:uncharacterized phiE125 gp8 family phage protein
MYSRVTDGTIEPITNSLAEAQLRLTNDSAIFENLQVYIQSARWVFENNTGILLNSQTWKLVLDEFPSSSFISLYKSPITSITSVQYYDEDDTLQTLDSSLYWTELTRIPACITIKDSWPSTMSGRPGSVIVNFACGYAEGECPNDIVNALLLLMTNYYENRQEGVIMPGVSSVEVPKGFEYVLRNYKIYQ